MVRWGVAGSLPDGPIATEGSGERLSGNEDGEEEVAGRGAGRLEAIPTVAGCPGGIWPGAAFELDALRMEDGTLVVVP